MAFLTDIGNGILAEIIRNFSDWSEYLHVAYLFSALLIATPMVAYQRWIDRHPHAHDHDHDGEEGNDARAGRTSRGFFEQLVPPRVFLHPSCQRDYIIFLINTVLFLAIAVSAVITPVVITKAIVVLAGFAGAAAVQQDVPLWVRLSYSAAMLLAWDFGATYAHYLKHRVPIFWEFHKVHHSAEAMTPLTAARRHPIDDVIGLASVAVVLGAANAAWIILFGNPGNVLTILGLPLGLFLWYLLGYNLRHSHMWVCYGRFWSQVFISPAQHQIHHSRHPRHYDKNFGHIFSFWDALFGTLYVPLKREKIRFGINPEEMSDYRSIRNLYLVPFKKAAKLISGPKPAASKASEPMRAG